MFQMALSSALAGLSLVSSTQEPIELPAARSHERTASEGPFGLSFYRPQHLEVHELIRYASYFTESSVFPSYPERYTGPRSSRARFLAIETSIGIQDSEAGRAEAIALLRELDARIIALRGEDVPEQAQSTRSLRLRSLGIRSAVELLGTMAPSVAVQVLAEQGALVLRGTAPELARAESLLLEVDQPLPQIVLRLRLLESVAPDHAEAVLLDPELRADLEKLLPGKRFTETGSFLMRTTVSGTGELDFSSSFGELAGGISSRISLRVSSRGWDQERALLSLGGCEISYQRIVHGRTESERLKTDLSLVHGEATAVGTLGANGLLCLLDFHSE
jgi:hypothetical protein